MKHVPCFVHITLAVCCLSVVAQICAARIPSPHDAGLLVATDAIPLTQADFTSGTYRISSPGYYYLTEDIAFNPDPVQEALRKDKPLADEWFTALSIECDNVIVDLNTKTFAVHPHFIDTQLLKVFSLIELANMPFPNIKKEFGFSDVTHAVYAHNVTIKNGTIGTSPHHGIHGNNNADVQLYDLVIRDWEVAGIALNGLKNGVIRNISISGLEHTFSFTGLVSMMLVARMFLNQFATQSDTTAKKFMDDLDVMIADPTQNGSIHPSGLNYGNAYGIFLNRTFDIGPVASARSPLSTNAILIEDVRIANIKIDTLEAVVIGDANGTAIAPELFGSMRWEDAYPQGQFKPNALLKAQVYILSKKNPAAMPAGFADNILSEQPQEKLFLSHARPVFNRDFPIHAQKGIYGIRIDAGYGVTIRNCSIMGLENVGKPGATLRDIPAGNNYSFFPGRFSGNDIHGIALIVCDNCTVDRCTVSDCTSLNGYVHGIALFNNAKANRIEHCKVSGLRGARDEEAKRYEQAASVQTHNDTSASVNPPSRVYGYSIRSNSVANHFIDCIAQDLEAPRIVYGIYVDSSRDTVITRALCSSYRTTSDQLFTGTVKRTCGIASRGSYTTAVVNSIVRDLVCANEGSGGITAPSQAVGYMFDVNDESINDQYGVVDGARAEYLHGGRGIAYGVYLDNAIDTTIVNSTAVRSSSAMRKGYGFYRTPNAKGSIVLRNTSYGNAFMNYEPSDTTWPTIELSSSNVHSLQTHNAWFNVSIKQ